MTPRPGMTVVGTYLTEREAGQARERLLAAGIDPVEITELAADAWQVGVPARHHDPALQELELMEQHNIADSY